MKLCKDCRYYRAQSITRPYAKCAKKIDPETGGPGAFIVFERAWGYDTCGPDGENWKPRPAGLLRRLNTRGLLATLALFIVASVVAAGLSIALGFPPALGALLGFVVGQLAICAGILLWM